MEDYLISQRKNIARSNSDLGAVTELGSKIHEQKEAVLDLLRNQKPCSDQKEETKILLLLQQLEEAERLLMKSQKTPSPPNSMKKKTTHTPRKTPKMSPARKMNPASGTSRKMTVGTEKTSSKFTIGINKNVDKLHTVRVRDERMKWEESLRKEKREYVMNRRRKSLLEMILISIPPQARRD